MCCPPGSARGSPVCPSQCGFKDTPQTTQHCPLAHEQAVDEAYERCVKGDVKFRFVIDTAKTLDKSPLDGK